MTSDLNLTKLAFPRSPPVTPSLQGDREIRVLIPVLSLMHRVTLAKSL